MYIIYIHPVLRRVVLNACLEVLNPCRRLPPIGESVSSPEKKIQINETKIKRGNRENRLWKPTTFWKIDFLGENRLRKITFRVQSSLHRIVYSIILGAFWNRNVLFPKRPVVYDITKYLFYYTSKDSRCFNVSLTTLIAHDDTCLNFRRLVFYKWFHYSVPRLIPCRWSPCIYQLDKVKETIVLISRTHDSWPITTPVFNLFKFYVI